MVLQQQNEKIQFPVSFRLKIISITYDTEDSAFQKFSKVLADNEIKYSNWDSKPSSGGRYASYRVDVTINNNETFKKIYADLGKLEGVRCVI
ncbi:MAG: DUF493 domain-containing protein [Spirochaetales bacterium]|nr:DUF493 domain-containing protein [Spirochaetales bacterium]